MAKPFIGYGICRETYSSDYRIVGITSKVHRQVYGRTVPRDEVTHFSERDLLGEHDTLASAKAALERADAKRKELLPEVNAAHARYELLNREMREAIRLAAGLRRD